MKARSCRLISRRAARTSTAVGSSCSDLPGWLAVPALVMVPSVAIHHQTRLANNLVQGLFTARLTAFVQKFLQKKSAAPNRGRLLMFGTSATGEFGFAGVCDPTDLRSTRDQRFAGGVAACPGPCGAGVLPAFFIPVACLACLAC